MAFLIRPALASDASAIDRLAEQFAGYLHTLGDQTDFNLNVDPYLRDGFGLQPAFKGLPVRSLSVEARRRIMQRLQGMENKSS